jgi:hypothetical protein
LVFAEAVDAEKDVTPSWEDEGGNGERTRRELRKS